MAPRARRAHGFALIELLAGVATACVLAALAYPSYQAIVLRSRRLDGQAALLQLQGSEERYRSTNAQYGDMADLRAATASPAGHYQLTVLSATARGYELLASALGPQRDDASCRHLKLAMVGEDIVYASGADAAVANSMTDNRRCWGL